MVFHSSAGTQYLISGSTEEVKEKLKYKRLNGSLVKFIVLDSKILMLCPEKIYSKRENDKNFIVHMTVPSEGGCDISNFFSTEFAPMKTRIGASTSRYGIM